MTLQTVAAFDRIGEENAFAVLARATELAAQGKDIINLGIGQPDFPTPKHIVEAAIKALRDGHHGYTPSVGIKPLREAVAASARDERDSDLPHLARHQATVRKPKLPRLQAVWRTRDNCLPRVVLL